MPSCSVIRDVRGTTALYSVGGKFEGACAWDLSGKLEAELLRDVVIDFSHTAEFVDYGLAVLANALQPLAGRRVVHLRGLRQHQLRLLKYFGVDPEELMATDDAPTARVPMRPPAFEREVG